MKSEKKLREILGLERTFKQKVRDHYLNYPISYDLLLSVMVLSINIFLKKINFIFIQYNENGLKDLLNELVSSSMSLGGFVLAAMAIIASVKEGTAKIKENEIAETGKDFFYNSSAYPMLLKSFVQSCLLYGAIFLYFSVVRSAADNIETTTLFNLVYFGLFVSLLTLFRCVYLVQAAVKIR